MARRHSRRINVFIDADLVFQFRRSYGFIGNISERGMYMRISSAQAGMQFIQGTGVDVTLTMQEEKTTIRCHTVWSYEIDEGNAVSLCSYRLGLEIVTFQSKYLEFYQDLVKRGIREYVRMYGFEITLE